MFSLLFSFLFELFPAVFLSPMIALFLAANRNFRVNSKNWKFTIQIQCKTYSAQVTIYWMIVDKWKGNKLERARYAVLGFRELYRVRQPRLDRESKTNIDLLGKHSKYEWVLIIFNRLLWTTRRRVIIRATNEKQDCSLTCPNLLWHIFYLRGLGHKVH